MGLVGDAAGLSLGGVVVKGLLKLCLWVAMLGFFVWITTLPCSSIKPKRWCRPPELTVGRAIVVVLVKKWDYLVHRRSRE